MNKKIKIKLKEKTKLKDKIFYPKLVSESSLY